MKLAANIVAVLLGAIFIVFGLNFFFPFITIPPLPEGSPAAAFIGAMYSTGYLKVVKILEIVGGLLLVLPRLRTLGLILIGAIVFNIACVHQFMFGGLKDPVVIFAVLACLFLAYDAWKKCCGCRCCASCPCGCQSDGSAGACCSTDSGSGCCGEKK
jgi:putative oxidoreductase